MNYHSHSPQPLRLDVDPLAASPLPIELELLKQYLAIDFADFDELIELNLLAAVQECENTTHRTVVRRAHRWVLRDFPWHGCQDLTLPRGKTRAVASVVVSVGGSITTLTGPTSTVPGTGFQEDLRGADGGVIMPP